MGLPEQLHQVALGLGAEWRAQPTLFAKLRRILAVLRVVLVRSVGIARSCCFLLDDVS